MKTSFLFLLLNLATLHQLVAQCETITLPYGQVQTDINRGYKIIPTQDGNFVVAGEWNNEAYLLKVDSSGQQLVLKKFGNVIGGSSSIFLDVDEAPDGGFVAVGECQHCSSDSLVKVVAIKTDADLNLNTTIGVKKFGQVTTGSGFTTLNKRSLPVLLPTGDTYLLAARIDTGVPLNPEDVVVSKLSGTLQPLWDSMYHKDFFESPYEMTATTDGIMITVNSGFTSTATLLKINHSGGLVWIKTYNANSFRGIAYLPAKNDVVVIGERTPVGEAVQALLVRFDADSGAVMESLLLGDTNGDYGYDIEVLPNGDLLAGIVSDQPNSFGIYATSRIYRVKSEPLTEIDYSLIPNPDDITNMAVRSIVPLSDDGLEFAACGIRGFYNRTFFHTQFNCITDVGEPEPGIRFQMSPNPFTDQIQVAIEVDYPNDARFEVHLTDVLGRLCKSFSLDAGGLQTLDVADLSKGIYFAQVMANKRILRVIRLVKQ